MSTLYNDELVATICGRMSAGESLNAILKEDDMPTYRTVMYWLKSKPDFLELYQCALSARADTLAEEMITIADEVCTILIDEEGQETKVVFDSTAVARNRLRADVRKWNASKMYPKKYGDKIAQEITATVTSKHEMTDAELMMIASGRATGSE